MKKIKINWLYFTTSLFMLFILSCDEEDAPSNVTGGSNISNDIFCLDMSYVIEGNEEGIDYASDGEDSRTVFTFSLKSTDDELCCSDTPPEGCIEPEPVPDASLTFDWQIINAPTSGSNQPHLVTIPTGNAESEMIYENMTATTNSNGEINAYWEDDNQSGCVFLFCDYMDGQTKLASLDVPDYPSDGETCNENSLQDSPNPFNVASILLADDVSIPAGCGTLTDLSLEGTATGLSNISILNIDGDPINLTYYGGGDIADGCSLTENNISLYNNSVIYNCNEEIGEFEFTVDNATIMGVSGGDAELAGFTISFLGSTATGSVADILTIDLDINPSTLIYNDLPSSVDTSATTDMLELEVIVENIETDQGVSSIPVFFTNLTPNYGTLINSSVTTDEYGVALNQLINIDTDDFDYTNTSDLITIKVQVFDEEGKLLQEDTENATIIPKSLDNIYQVQSLDATFLQTLNTINNATVIFEDQIFAQVTDGNSGVHGVPVDFSFSTTFVSCEALGLNSCNDGTCTESAEEQCFCEEIGQVTCWDSSCAASEELCTTDPNENNNTQDNVGFIHHNTLWSDSLGVVYNTFALTPADLANVSRPVVVNIDISVGTDKTKSLQKTYTLAGNSNIEYDISTFNLYPQSLEIGESLTEYAFADSTGEYGNVSSELAFIAKNEAGIAVSGVPVQFEIYESGIRSNGELSAALAFTCCDNEEEDEEENEEENDSGNQQSSSTICNQPGVACVSYTNGALNTYDRIRAFITDPLNGTTNLKFDEVKVQTAYIDEQVASLNSYFNPPAIEIVDPTQSYCSDIFTVANNANHSPLENIPIHFSSKNTLIYTQETQLGAGDDTCTDLNGTPVVGWMPGEICDNSIAPYGYISSSFELTNAGSDTTSTAFKAKTTFCTYPGLDLSTNIIDIPITATIQNNTPNQQGSPTTLSTIANMDLSQYIPPCPDCEQSITLAAQYYELPAGQNKDIFTSQITATLIDSTGNLVPPYTIVQFQSVTQSDDDDDNDDGGGALILDEQMGSIDPYAFTGTDENGLPSGLAQATFNMGGDVGLAYIIADAPEYGMSDTLYVTLSSTDAETIEIIEPYPFNLTIAGGGGAESTEIGVEIDDGAGNLVTQSFLVRFQLLDNTPEGVFLNDGEYDHSWQISSNGLASVSINSGSRPGTVPIRVELFYLGTQDQGCGTGSENEEIFAYNPNGADGEKCKGIVSDANNFAHPGNNQVSPNFSSFGISFAEGIPVTIVTGPPHSGNITFSTLDIVQPGAGVYRMPIAIEYEDIYANPVQDCTSVYSWVEAHAPAWSPNKSYVLNDTIKFGIETEILENGTGTGEYSVDIRDSLLYVLQVPYLGSSNASPNQLNSSATGNNYGTADTNPSGCNCYKEELINECADACYWEVVPNQPGWITGETRTGIEDELGLLDAVPGVAWSYAYFTEPDFFKKITFKSLAYDIDGEEILVDYRDTNGGIPLRWPLTEDAEINLTADIESWDFILQGSPWTNDFATGPSGEPGGFLNGIRITATVEDYYQTPVSDAVLQLTAGGSGVTGLGTDTFYDWIACNPYDSDGDTITGKCYGTVFNNGGTQWNGSGCEITDISEAVCDDIFPNPDGICDAFSSFGGTEWNGSSCEITDSDEAGCDDTFPQDNICDPTSSSGTEWNGSGCEITDSDEASCLNVFPWGNPDTICDTFTSTTYWDAENSQCINTNGVVWDGNGCLIIDTDLAQGIECGESLFFGEPDGYCDGPNFASEGDCISNHSISTFNEEQCIANNVDTAWITEENCTSDDVETSWSTQEGCELDDIETEWVTENDCSTDDSFENGIEKTEYENDCGLCRQDSESNVWYPETSSVADPTPQSGWNENATLYDDDQTLCKTDGYGKCTWIIYYFDQLVPQIDDANPPNYQQFVSGLSAELVNPTFLTDQGGLQITLDKTEPFTPPN